MTKVYNKNKLTYKEYLSLIDQGAVYVGRPSKWGNPYTIGKCYSVWLERKTIPFSREDVIKAYKEYMINMPALTKEAKEELKGKDLICWCAPEACHADVLLEIANS